VPLPCCPRLAKGDARPAPWRCMVPQGVGTAHDIDTGMKLGTNQPMGPLALAGEWVGGEPGPVPSEVAAQPVQQAK
jgi:hypothetical protein